MSDKISLDRLIQLAENRELPTVLEQGWARRADTCNPVKLAFSYRQEFRERKECMETLFFAAVLVLLTAVGFSIAFDKSRESICVLSLATILGMVMLFHMIAPTVPDKSVTERFCKDLERLLEKTVTWSTGLYVFEGGNAKKVAENFLFAKIELVKSIEIPMEVGRDFQGHHSALVEQDARMTDLRDTYNVLRDFDLVFKDYGWYFRKFEKRAQKITG